MATMAVGSYQTACEQSPHKLQIDQWINEGKSNAWMSRELRKLYEEEISDKSIAKYRGYREEFIQRQLEQDPMYQGKLQVMNQQLADGIGQIKQVDVIGKLAETIEHCADMINDARDRDVKIKTVQDMRFMQMTMLDSIKLYGDTVLKAQRFQAIEQDPSLLKPTTISIGVKATLVDILKEAMKNGNGYGIIDQLRRGAQDNVPSGIQCDIVGDRSSIVDGEPQDIEG